jgi:WD40 repeat protein
LLAGSAGSVVFVWDLLGPPDALPWTWRGRSGATFTVAFHPSATWLATSSAGATALGPVARDRYPYVLRGHRGAVREVAFGPDGSWLVSASEDGTVRWWPLTPAAGSASRVLHDWGRIWDADLVPAHMPHFLAVAPDGAWVAVVGHGLETLAVVPVAGGEARRLHSGGDAPFAAVAVDPAGRRVAAALGMYGHRDAILVWDLETDEVRRIEAGGRVCDLRFLPDGSLLDTTYAGTAFDLTSSEEQASIGRRDLATLERRRIDVTHGMHRLHLSADGRLVLGFGSVEEDQGDGRLAVVLRDLVEGTSTELPQFGGLAFFGQKMALSPSGRLAAVQGVGVLTVGRTAGGEPHRIVVDHVTSVAISPDDRWIAVGQGDGDVLLWPVPDLDHPPVDTLPRDELVARIEALTNARAVRDDRQPDGWGIEWAPFPGWEDVPEW